VIAALVDAVFPILVMMLVSLLLCANRHTDRKQ
jgi:hypothetical protein